MDNAALLALFRRLALASAPLIWAGCDSPNPTTCNNPSETMTVSLSAFDAGTADPNTDGGLADLCSRAVPGRNILTCELVTANGGQAVRVVSQQYCVGGRRPAGLCAPEGPGTTSPLGAWLAGMAHLEAASVDAFEILAGELDAHGAPPALARAARVSARDERRHARLMSRLAAAAGARPPAVRVARRAPRALEAIARENAVEGCVRETFAALVACRQARAAGDPAIRATMNLIAPDETRHAALSWTVDAWASERLPAAARRRVLDARREATAELIRDVAASEPEELRVPAGLPDGDVAVQMASSLFTRLG